LIQLGKLQGVGYEVVLGQQQRALEEPDVLEVESASASMK
jgi:hypothetical protein